MSDPVEVERLKRWVEGYVRAWDSNDPDEIGGLFSEDARYYTAPHREPMSGRDAIVADWLERKDEPGTWSFTWDVLLAAEEGPSFVTGQTDYDDGADYSNLWVIHLEPDGTCSRFVEWWMERD